MVVLRLHTAGGSLRQSFRIQILKLFDNHLITSLTDSLLLYQADRFDVRGKNILKTNAKYYLVDPAC